MKEKPTSAQIKEMKTFLAKTPKYASYYELSKFLQSKYTNHKRSILLAFAIENDFERFCLDD